MQRFFAACLGLCYLREKKKPTSFFLVIGFSKQRQHTISCLMLYWLTVTDCLVSIARMCHCNLYQISETFTDLFFKWQNNLSRNTNQIHFDSGLQLERTKLPRTKAFYQLWNFHFLKSSLNRFTVLVQWEFHLKAHYKLIAVVFLLSDESYLKWQCISVKCWYALSISEFAGSKIIEKLK